MACSGEEARTAEDALRIASTAALDAVILDVDLSGMDGVSACRRIREVSRVPVIFLSASARACTISRRSGAEATASYRTQKSSRAGAGGIASCPARREKLSQEFK